MALTFDDPNAPRLPERSERMAKAILPKADGQAKADARKAERRLIGQAIERTRQLAGLSLKEFAATVDRDERQCARWIDGSEPAQLGAILAVVAFRPLLILAFAEVAGDGVEIETQIRVRRRA